MLSFTCLPDFVSVKDNVETVFVTVIIKEFVTQKTLIKKKKVNID